MVDLAEVRADFAPLESRVAAVYVWGSHARGGATPRSDIDVCIIAGPGVGVDAALRWTWSDAHLGGKPYDLKVFEELPLFLQGAVLDEGLVVLTRDPVSLSEYLRPWARRWADQRHRARMAPEEVRRMLEARRVRSGRA